jgi:hypothetical protein
MTVAGFGSKQKNEKWRVAEAYIIVADAIYNSNRQNPSSTLFPSRYLVITRSARPISTITNVNFREVRMSRSVIIF